MQSTRTKHIVFLQSLVLLGIILFAFFLASERGFIELTLKSDRSYLSYVILTLYFLATLHWILICYRLSAEITALDLVEQELWFDFSSQTDLAIERYFTEATDLTKQGARYQGLLEAFGDRIYNRHATGHFISDILLKIGLLGTIIGFILMLMPVAEIKEFEGNFMQQLLGEMSEGMAVALYTTLAGLSTSMLLKMQYQIIDSSAAKLVTRVSELSELRFARQIKEVGEA
ncbi:MAG TPA: MotA/TolQ/ExbB proton channel family protein [Pseudomonadales bacterium]|jgi:hypothetical protein|nr:hypothetical protein [Gammaproteobacteria bacterium]MDP6027820.1 MotA/TolQ/ExbB proton channel family protein [Pseudomonadales bacterium]MDP6315955.1 MotA/TolQ/ExbB proton channel family protein [Pseudomonadales bacterium]MDP7576122.1 MotA/TolQ/ExbB proton channel family protein [Pseudomonadales bacterium]HJL61480.1 MotA/TolQ/ExbB proton channel family protein [Pseudomonadales bacterium]|tara:strand:+ start:893 stop:1582 length:690 start_codon:yes stop_codon:yes gene_type:complete